MAVITNPLLQALRTQLNADFKRGFESAEPNHKPIMMKVPSTSASNTYGWIGKMASVRKWVGDRVVNDLAEHGYTIFNDKFELTHGVERTDIEDDNLGIYSTLFEDIGSEMAKHEGEMVYAQVEAGFTTLCYDGQYFFDTDHPVNANHDGTGAVTSVSNIQPGTGTNAPWYLIDGSRTLKPIIYQERKKPVFTAMTKLDDESVFMSDKFRFGSDKRAGIGFGLWQQMIASKEELNETNFTNASMQMAGFKADGGKPLGLNPTILLVGISNLAAAEKLINTEKLSGGGSNTLYKKATIVYSPYLP